MLIHHVLLLLKDRLLNAIKKQPTYVGCFLIILNDQYSSDG
ncbi:hypothetical protein VCEM1676A_002054 [Vibrio cholerae O1 str. EM-1676A]|nr:hypothetical protein VCEM1676A_002054 [Vibrio cholerae O1 str. EM-1676A]EMQ65945.1 hypothetical protein VCNHCC008D_002234 [Vibrio cholerae O1 str. NHCC-008D]